MEKSIRTFVNHWAEISVYLAGGVALLAILLPLSVVEKLLLASIAVLFLHFFEEFSWPGGFAYMGMTMIMGCKEKDPAKWNCNNLSSLYGNWGFLLLIYVVPLFFPHVAVLTLAVMLFNAAEFLGHTFMFNIRLRKCYNPGMITALFGLAPISIYYFVAVFDASLFAWYHYLIAFACCAVVFWLCFRSPWYWWLGRQEGYTFSEQAAFGLFEH